MEVKLVACPHSKCGKKFKKYLTDERTGVCPACGGYHEEADSNEVWEDTEEDDQ